MSAFTDYEITEAMIWFGGSFVEGLGRLYRKADAENQRKLRQAFPEYFSEYAALAAQRRQQLNSAVVNQHEPDPRD